jgi:alginate O-acetyltransferase complex protein AlgI
MIISAVINYLSALGVSKFVNYKKLVMTINIIINLGILVYFKYTGFLVEQFNGFFNLSIPVPQITLPIGISFFTFQAMSYVIDVYRGSVDVQKNFAKVLLYISFFPQLIAGPIVKYHDINKELDNRKVTVEESAKGLRRFICGLCKKILIANTMGLTADTIFSATTSEVSVVTSWIGAIAYMFQIYYDFSGYSDMAIGLGKMFGFNFLENFCYPYGAVSIKDFWRRWHISLSSWFKEYLYIPLGGNRKGKFRTCVNKIIVFFFTGLWHGANWTFVIWGLFHGLFLLLEEYFSYIKKLPKFILHIYTLLVVCVGFVIFRADNISQAFFMLQQMFTGFDLSSASVSLAVQQFSPWFIFVAIIAIIGVAPIRPIADKVRNIISSDVEIISKKRMVIQVSLYVISFVLLFWCIIRLSGEAYNPFIYFRF